MKLGFVGLGRMGGNMVTRLLQGGHQVVAWDRSAEAVAGVVKSGAAGGSGLADLVSKLEAPRTLWVMLPAGDPTEQTLQQLHPLLSKGDTVIEGGNSNYHDTQRRAMEAAAHGIDYMDSGTSGGIWGLKNGYCLMIGGTPEAFRRNEPIFKTLAPPGGCLHVGPPGAGHYVKMIHNGIEYGMMQAYGEGFEILQNAPFPLDLTAISHLWNQGSVVRSWLLELAEDAFRKDPGLAGIRDYVEDSGEGRWTILEAMDRNVPTPILTLSLQARFASRQESSFSAKVVAALRNEFGGHAVKKSGS